MSCSYLQFNNSFSSLRLLIYFLFHLSNLSPAEHLPAVVELLAFMALRLLLVPLALWTSLYSFSSWGCAYLTRFKNVFCIHLCLPCSFTVPSMLEISFRTHYYRFLFPWRHQVLIALTFMYWNYLMSKNVLFLRFRWDNLKLHYLLSGIPQEFIAAQFLFLLFHCLSNEARPGSS